LLAASVKVSAGWHAPSMVQDDRGRQGKRNDERLHAMSPFGPVAHPLSRSSKNKLAGQLAHIKSTFRRLNSLLGDRPRHAWLFHCARVDGSMMIIVSSARDAAADPPRHQVARRTVRIAQAGARFNRHQPRALTANFSLLALFAGNADAHAKKPHIHTATTAPTQSSLMAKGGPLHDCVHVTFPQMQQP
jgi:hypothetical protein